MSLKSLNAGIYHGRSSLVGSNSRYLLFGMLVGWFGGGVVFVCLGRGDFLVSLALRKSQKPWASTFYPVSHLLTNKQKPRLRKQQSYLNVFPFSLPGPSSSGCLGCFLMNLTAVCVCVFLVRRLT